jgi:hypothetical protein
MKTYELNVMEKIAMIWTLPLAVVITVVLITVSIAVYLLRVVFIFSGTAGSAIWIIDKIKQRWKSHQWNKIRERDGLSSTIDSMSK